MMFFPHRLCYTCYIGLLFKFGTTMYVYETKQAIRITYHEGLFQLTNSYEYIMYGTRMARDGHKLHVIWVGPLPIVSVDHPETFKQLIAQTSDKPIGQADPYRIIMPWIGGLKFTKCKNNAILHIRAFYVALIFVIVRVKFFFATKSRPGYFFQKRFIFLPKQYFCFGRFHN